jgi:hypothetical protein
VGVTSAKSRVAAFASALALGACGGTSGRHTEQGGAAGSLEPADAGGTAGLSGSLAGTGAGVNTGGAAGTASAGAPSGAFSATGGASNANPSGCCTRDADCGPVPCVNGYCVDNTPDVCARDDACPAGMLCSGAFLCVCGEPCARANTPGSCVPADAGCCLSDEDCGDGECVRGVCKAKAGDFPACWRSSDCAIPEYLCMGANFCACGTSCFVADAPGVCRELFK